MPPDIEISGLLPTSIQTSASSKTWEPPSQRPCSAFAMCFPGWSIVAAVKTIREPSASSQPIANGIVAGCGPA
jgi:hypothetical protein